MDKALSGGTHRDLIAKVTHDEERVADQCQRSARRYLNIEGVTTLHRAARGSAIHIPLFRLFTVMQSEAAQTTHSSLENFPFLSQVLLETYRFLSECSAKLFAAVFKVRVT